MTSLQNSAPPSTTPRRRRPVRFYIGIALLILCGLLYISIAVTAFLPLDGVTKAATIGGTIAVAEVSFLLGVAGVGKEAYQAVKARFSRKKKDAAVETVEPGAPVEESREETPREDVRAS